MTTNTSQVFESYVPIYDVVPEKWDEARPFLVETLKKITNGVNVREIGWWLDEELLSGKQLFPGTSTPNDQAFRSMLRKVIDFGALPNATVNSVAHGIVVDANFTLVLLEASATKPTSAFASVPIPFASPTLNKSIQIDLDATNINITTAIDYSAYTRCLVTIEYVQEQ